MTEKKKAAKNLNDEISCGDRCLAALAAAAELGISDDRQIVMPAKRFVTATAAGRAEDEILVTDKPHRTGIGEGAEAAADDEDESRQHDHAGGPPQRGQMRVKDDPVRLEGELRPHGSVVVERRKLAGRGFAAAVHGAHKPLACPDL